MKIIGINDGHNASVCLTENEKIKFAISEERIIRKKNYWGFPNQSLDYIYKNYYSKEEIDYFGFYRDTPGDFLVYLWSHHNQNDDRNYIKKLKKIIGFIGENYLKILSAIIPKKIVIKYYSKLLSVPEDKIILLNHHRSHIESVSFSLDKNLEWLIFSIDGQGDLESGTIYKKNFQGKIEKITSISNIDSLGYFYTWITEYLGMKPNEHEFKVMGLEPYVRKNTNEYKRVYNKLSKLFYFINNDYKSKIDLNSKKYKKWLKKNLYKERFDNISAAAQIVLEEVVLKWINNWIQESNINNIAVTGGTMMNVKLVQKISELNSVDKIYIMPSAGDETTVLGVCNFIYKAKTGNELQNLEHLYFGINWDSNKINIWANNIDRKKFIVSKFENINEEVSNLLASGHIIARFNGSDEFGARALGNRSILAHPSNPETIATINKLIKDRDFWMPFTPSIIYEKANLYIQNEKNLYSPFMALTFNTTELGDKDFSAAIHPYDRTMRIQMVKANINPSYYELISLFGSKTGIYGLLNTSFNLHGEPNVCFPNDCLHTLSNSGLKYLVIDKYLIEKI